MKILNAWFVKEHIWYSAVNIIITFESNVSINLLLYRYNINQMPLSEETFSIA